MIDLLTPAAKAPDACPKRMMGMITKRTLTAEGFVAWEPMRLGTLSESRKLNEDNPVSLDEDPHYGWVPA